MKKYKCHKVVEAAKIIAWNSVVNGDVQFKLETGEWAFISKTKVGDLDKDLGYYVKYADGYISWSPTKAFEEGYSEIYEAVPGSARAHLTLTTFDNQLLEVVEYHDKKLLALAVRPKSYEHDLYFAMLEQASVAISDKFKD